MKEIRAGRVSTRVRLALSLPLCLQLVAGMPPAVAADLSACPKMSSAEQAQFVEWERGGCSTRGAKCALQILSIKEVETKLREVQAFNLKHANDSPPRSQNLKGGFSACDGVRQVYALEEYSDVGQGDVFSAGPDAAPSTTKPGALPPSGGRLGGGGESRGDICAKSPDSYRCLYGSRRPPSGAPQPQGGGERGGKTIVRNSPPDESASANPTAANVAAVIDACLQNSASGLTYYRSPILAAGSKTVSYDSSGDGAIRYSPTFLNGLSPSYRAFWLADAYATHVLNLEQQRFNVGRPPRELQRARDYLAGYAVHCAYFNFSALGEPRAFLTKYHGGPYHFSFANEPTRGVWEFEDWNNGWNDQAQGVHPSLRHDPARSPTPFDPYRWPR